MANYQRQIRFVAELRRDIGQLTDAMEVSFANVDEFTADEGQTFFDEFFDDEAEEPGITLQEFLNCLATINLIKVWMKVDGHDTSLYKVKE